MLDVFKFPGCINNSCLYTVSLKVIIFATGTVDIFRISVEYILSVKYILIQIRRPSYSACYKKWTWAIIYAFQKVLRLPYVTFGVLVSLQDTTEPWQRDKNLAGTLWLPSTKKTWRSYQYNHGTVSRLQGEKRQEGWGCWARWPPPDPSNLDRFCDMKSSEIQLKVKEHFSDVFNPSKPDISLEASFKNASVT